MTILIGLFLGYLIVGVASAIHAASVWWEHKPIAVYVITMWPIFWWKVYHTDQLREDYLKRTGMLKDEEE